MCHKRLKNTIDLLLFYWEHFYGLSESDENLKYLFKILAVPLQSTLITAQIENLLLIKEWPAQINNRNIKTSSDNQDTRTTNGIIPWTPPHCLHLLWAGVPACIVFAAVVLKIKEFKVHNSHDSQRVIQTKHVQSQKSYESINYMNHMNLFGFSLVLLSRLCACSAYCFESSNQTSFIVQTSPSYFLCNKNLW